jgi:hypothetical protein
VPILHLKILCQEVERQGGNRDLKIQNVVPELKIWRKKLLISGTTVKQIKNTTLIVEFLLN